MQVVSVINRQLLTAPATVQTAANGVLGWGNTLYGQNAPPPPPAGKTYTKIVVGVDAGLGLLSDGTLVGWGNDAYGKAKPPAPPSGTTFTDMAIGANASIGLLSDGSAVAWGSNQYCQLGGTLGLSINEALGTPMPCTDPVGWSSTGKVMTPADPNNPYVMVASGTFNQYAVRKDGSINTVGGAFDTSAGEVVYPCAPGRASDYDSNATSWTKFVASGMSWAGLTNTGLFVATTNYRTFLRPDSNGILPAAVINNASFLTGTTFLPLTDACSVVSQSGVKDFALGASHALLLMSDGSLAQKGVQQVPVAQIDSYNQWSLISPTADVVPLPVADAGHHFVQVAAGFNYSMALQDNGYVKAAGRNDVGQLDVPYIEQGWRITSLVGGWYAAAALLANH
jgi:hypothetical protein